MSEAQIADRSRSELRYRANCIVWGESYIERFLSISLPTQISPNNLPAAVEKGKTEYFIYTISTDEAQFRAHKSFQKLTEIVDVTFIFIDKFFPECLEQFNKDFSGRYEVMNACHCHFLAASASDSLSRLIFMSPDAIYSDGTFRFAIDANLAGKRCVVSSAYRVNIETFIPKFHELYGNQPCISVDSNQVVRFICDHPHPETTAWYRHTPKRSRHPGAMLWRVENEGFLSHYFYLFVLVMEVTDFSVMPTVTLDADYLNSASFDDADFAIVDDSDDGAILEFSNPQHNDFHMADDPYDFATLTEWMKQHVNQRQSRLFFKQPVRMHYRECSSAWSDVEAEAREFINTLDLIPALKAQEAIKCGERIRHLSACFVITFREMIDGNYLQAFGALALLAQQGGPLDHIIVLAEIVCNKYVSVHGKTEELFVLVDHVHHFFGISPADFELFAQRMAPFRRPPMISTGIKL